ncbi:MAG: phospholipase D-like domain-containing protein [Gemmataceae bacterium]
MDVMLVATGFTGAFTCRWLFESLLRNFSPPAEISPHFATTSDLGELLLQVITSAKKEILVACSGPLSRPVAEALLDARKRKVQVEIIGDPGEQAGTDSDLRFLAEQGVPIRIDEQMLSHSKLMIVDGRHVLMGCFSLNSLGEVESAESLIHLENNREGARIYREHYQARKSRCKDWAPTASPRPIHGSGGVLPPGILPMNPHTQPVRPAAILPDDSVSDEERPVPVTMGKLSPSPSDLFARLRKELADASSESGELEPSSPARRAG